MLNTHVDLFLEYKKSRSIKLRNRLVVLNDPLAISIASRYRQKTSEPHDDLVQEARRNLIIAVERYDPATNVPFGGFAIPVIQRGLDNYLRDKVPIIHSRHLHELAHKIRRAEAELAKELKRSPTIAEIANSLDMGVEKLKEVKQSIAVLNNNNILPDDVSVIKTTGAHTSEINYRYQLNLSNLKSYELQLIHSLVNMTPDKAALKLRITQQQLFTRLRNAFDNIKVCD